MRSSPAAANGNGGPAVSLTSTLCCAGPDSALTRLRDHLPSEWKPSLMPLAFHNALGGILTSDAQASAALKSVQNSHFFQLTERDRDDSRSGWKLDGLQQEVRMGNLDQPDDVSPISWVLGRQYLKCMTEGDTEKMIDGMHFFRPSALYNTFGFLRKPSAEKHQAAASESLEKKVLGSYPGPAKELPWLIKTAQAVTLSPASKIKATAAHAILSLSAAVAGAGGTPLALPVALGAPLSNLALLKSRRIMDQLLLRRVNKMDADYLRDYILPAVERYCDPEKGQGGASASSFSQAAASAPEGSTGFLQLLPAHGSGASAADGAEDRVKMLSPAGRGASRVAGNESDEISDGTEDDEVALEQLTTNLLQHVEKIQSEETNADGVAAGEGSDSTGRDEIEAIPTAVPAAWPTASIGDADVGRAWKTRWGGAASRRMMGDDNPQQEPESAKDPLASQGDTNESDHELQQAIEEN